MVTAMVPFKKYLIAGALTLVLASPGWAQGIITGFSAAAQDDDFVVLEWNSGDETGLQQFLVERSLDGVSFEQIENLAPLGNNQQYRYEDHDLYGKTTGRTYYYRVCAAMNSGASIFSPVQAVTLFFSGIQQTWGSIKALFR